IMYLPIIFRRLFMYMKTMVRERILLNMKGRQLVVYVSDIMYMERDKRMTKVICKDETLTTAADLTALVNQIGRHDVIRCHNSYVINFRYVREFRRNEFVLTDGTVIPVSRRYLDETRNEFSIWIAK
ncbi:MAG: LytTR family DNA-binding domain-containing protein, partial [Firmicutes bacterium]|nr:LytTR family DNA-binding domain-containing protein [Bacillota bacterium]